jgi:hypothetical protein
MICLKQNKIGHLLFCFCEWAANHGDKIKVCRKGAAVGWKTTGEARGREGRARKKGGNLIPGKLSHTPTPPPHSATAASLMEETPLALREQIRSTLPPVQSKQGWFEFWKWGRRATTSFVSSLPSSRHIVVTIFLCPICQRKE